MTAVEQRVLVNRIQDLERRARHLKTVLAKGHPKPVEIDGLASALDRWLVEFDAINNDPACESPTNPKLIRGTSPHQMDELLKAEDLFTSQLKELRRATMPESA